MRAELQTLHANIEETGNAKRRWHSRSSLRVMLHDDDGHVGVGEAAPLPGMSPESARDARKAVAALDWPESPPLELEAIGEVVSRIDPAVPSARFAAESALLSLAASIRGVPMWKMWTDEAEELAVAAALFGTKDTEVLQAAREAAAYEVIAVKAKVGWLPSQREIALLRDVRSIVGPIELRLDANGAFSKKELGDRLEALAELEPSFLEEPCSIEDLSALSEVPFPIAVDESLVGTDAEERLERALECEHVRVVVLKPTLLGGLERCRALAKIAREAGRDVIVSHTMEGVIARAAAAHLALALGGRATGLGDHPALSVLSDGLTAPWIDLAWIEPPTAPGLGLELAW